MRGAAYHGFFPRYLPKRSPKLATQKEDDARWILKL